MFYSVRKEKVTLDLLIGSLPGSKKIDLAGEKHKILLNFYMYLEAFARV